MTPAARREAVAHLRQAFEMSQRRACRVTGAERSCVRYRSTRPADEPLRARLRELAMDRRRFGYRRLHVFLKAEGLVVNIKKTERLYREEGLKVRRRHRRLRAIGVRAPIPVPTRANAAGRSILSTIRWFVGGAFECLWCRTMSRRSVWRRCPIPRSAAGAWCASLTR